MTIVDSLKAKGSTGGNNIAEAINNLPMGGSGGEGGLFLVSSRYDTDLDASILDKTWDEIVSAIKNMQMLIVLTETDSGARFFIFPGTISYNTLNDNQEPEKSIAIYYDAGSEYRRYTENEDGVLVLSTDE